VICLGDSITFGYGVADETPYPRQLELLLSRDGEKYEVVNGGVQRYSTYQEIDQLKQYGLPLNPKIVVLGVYINDMGIRPATESYTEEYENEREQVATSFRNRFPWVYLMAKNSALIELFRLKVLNRKSGGSTVRKLEGRLTDRDEEAWSSFRTEVSDFHRIAQDHDFRTLVVTIPSRYQIVNDLPNSVYPRRVIAICEELGLENIDFVNAFQKSLHSGTDPYLAWDNHLSPDGHRIVAEGIHQWVKAGRE
jgi:lysophospholipase L1-like esterase